MAKAVVDRLEAVDVEEGNGHELAGPRHTAQRHVQPIVEQPPVRQSRQLVVCGLAQHAIAVGLLDGHVANGRDPRATRLAQQAGRHLDREALPAAADTHHLGPRAGFEQPLGPVGRLEQALDRPAEQRRTLVAEDRESGRIGALNPRRPVEHEDALRDRIHDRPQSLLALTQLQLSDLGLGDVRVDSEHAAVGQPRLADP